MHYNGICPCPLTPQIQDLLFAVHVYTDQTWLLLYSTVSADDQTLMFLNINILQVDA